MRLMHSNVVRCNVWGREHELAEVGATDDGGDGPAEHDCARLEQLNRVLGLQEHFLPACKM